MILPLALGSGFLHHQQSPVRRMAFYFTIAFLFLRISMLHEAVTILLGFNTYVLYLVAPPAIGGFLLCRGWQWAFPTLAPRLWMGLAACMILAIPFSHWIGGSVSHVWNYLRFELPPMLLAIGLTTSWKECRLLLGTIALGGIFNLTVGTLFMGSDENRLSLSFGTIANSNDYAAHLLFVIPMLLMVVWTKRFFLSRLVALGGVAYGSFLVLLTGSRGALVALAVTGVVAFLIGTNRLRLMILVLVPFSLIAGLAMLPAVTRNRILTFSSSSEDAHAEAVLTTDIRSRLLWASLRYTARRPLTGVGPGQFVNMVGPEMKQQGLIGMWFSTHNSLTQISSECGIPALLFMVGALVSTFNLARRLLKVSRARADLAHFEAPVFCVMLSMVAFTTAILFLNFGYRFYLPLLTGIIVAIACAAQYEMLAKSATPAQHPMPAAGFRTFRTNAFSPATVPAAPVPVASAANAAVRPPYPLAHLRGPWRRNLL